MKFLLESMTVLGFSSYLVHTRLGKAGQNKQHRQSQGFQVPAPLQAHWVKRLTLCSPIHPKRLVKGCAAGSQSCLKCHPPGSRHVVNSLMKLVQEIGRLTTASEEVKRWGKGKVLGYFSMSAGRVLLVFQKKTSQNYPVLFLKCLTYETQWVQWFLELSQESLEGKKDNFTN